MPATIDPKKTPAPAATDKPAAEKPAAAAAPDAAKAEKPAASANKETLGGVNRFLQRTLGNRYKGPDGKPTDGDDAAKPADGDKPADDGKPKEGDYKPKADKPAAKPKAAKKPPFKPQHLPGSTSEPLTSADIAAAAAEGVAREFAKKDAAKAEGAKTDAPKLSRKEENKRNVLERMEVLFPEEYKGLRKKYEEADAKLSAYVADWEAKHPNEKFNEEDPEHEAFLDSNDVSWEDDDYVAAHADVIADKKLAEHTGKVQEKLSALERQEQIRAAGHEIQQEQNQTALSFWGELGDDFADIVRPDGSVNKAKLAELQKADPEGTKTRIEYATALDAEVAELYKIMTWPETNDPKNNPVHRALNTFAFEKEQALMRMPAADRMNEQGQVFIPADRYYRLPRAEREKHWTFSREDLAVMRAGQLASIANNKAAAAEEAHKEWARAKGIQLENPDEKPDSPSMGGGESRMAASAEPAAKTTAQPGSRFFKSFTHRK